MSIYDVFSGGRPFNKEEWAAQKQEQRKAAYELIDNTCSEMMANGDSFRQYLDVQGHFDRCNLGIGTDARSDTVKRLRQLETEPCLCGQGRTENHHP